MQVATPHYLLYSETTASTDAQPRWRFVLQPIGGDNFVTADEPEPETSGNRLELLAVVRGLEALDQPSRVTLLTSSRYVNRGLRRGIGHWKDRQWRWERFGQLVPIRNQDLWQRIDRAMRVHQVEVWPLHLAEEGRRETESTSGALTVHDRPADSLSTVEAAAEAKSVSSTVVRRCDGGHGTFGARPSGRFLSTWNRLRQGVLAPLAAVWRPAFTRAA